ncbi:DMT family transporter [Ferrovibrio sp.]|uniref:DMT family transporter n=1 Tax=Ferrovibrio sp. TaxID=1917215 RepID=UPI00262227F2|nr:DMT family transporter [Ferrovibrio sp.]
MTGRVWLLLGALSLLWGGSFFFIGVAVRELPPFTIVASRVVLAALVLLVVLRVMNLRLPRQHGLWLAFLGMGLLNNAIPFTLIVWGQSQIPSGLASILNATTPISTALVAHAFTSDEKLTPARILGVLLGLAGVAVMLGADLLGGLGQNLPAQAACLLATVSYAFAGVFGRRFRRMGVPPLVTASGQLIASSLLLLPLALVIDRPWGFALPGWPVIAALVALAVFSTALAYVIFFRVMAVAGSNVNLVTLLVPVSAILLGVLVLGESLLPRHLLGFGVIALGLLAIDGRLLRILKPAPPGSHP